jgi:hypothetical protein
MGAYMRRAKILVDLTNHNMLCLEGTWRGVDNVISPDKFRRFPVIELDDTADNQDALELLHGLRRISPEDAMRGRYVDHEGVQYGDPDPEPRPPITERMRLSETLKSCESVTFQYRPNLPENERYVCTITRTMTEPGGLGVGVSPELAYLAAMRKRLELEAGDLLR